MSLLLLLSEISIRNLPSASKIIKTTNFKISKISLPALIKLLSLRFKI